MTIDVIPRNGTVNNKTLDIFIKKFWQTLCPVPKNNNPAWQNNGNKDGPFNNNVNEDLYMLCFSRNPQTAVTRNIHVPSNKGLFIPVMSVVVSECEIDGNLNTIANTDQNSIHPPSVSLELDGTSIQHNNYRFNASALGTFNVSFPSKNEAIFDITNDLDSCNAVAAGIYVWTKPLSTGQHTVHFTGELHCKGPNCIDTDYSENITYNITVP
jgi:hypothetical protein